MKRNTHFKRDYTIRKETYKAGTPCVVIKTEGNVCTVTVKDEKGNQRNIPVLENYLEL